MVIWIVTRACQPGVKISPAGATKRNTGWVGLILGDEEFVGDPWVALASENGLLLDFGCFYCGKCIPSTGDYLILDYWYCYWIHLDTRLLDTRLLILLLDTILILDYWYYTIGYYTDTILWIFQKSTMSRVSFITPHNSEATERRWTPGSRNLSSYSAQQLGKMMAGGTLLTLGNLHGNGLVWKSGEFQSSNGFLEPQVG